MTGEFNFSKFSKFLKSFWGVLASFSVILPTLIYFSNTTQIKESVLGEFYIGIPTSFAFIVIPFVFLYEDRLSMIKLTRRISILFISCSLISLFAFIAVKNIYITDLDQSNINQMETLRIQTKRSGEIKKEYYRSLNDQPYKTELGTNNLEFLCLLLFTVSIISLTAAFSIIGVFYYTKLGT